VTSVTASDAPSESELKTQVWRHLPLILTLVGFAPLMWWHFAQLLQKPHYQFVIFLPIALYLLYISLPERQEPRPKSVWELAGGAALLMVACAGLAFATLYWSPWVASVAFLVAVLASLLFIGGMQTLSRWFPVWVFCLAIVPLPFGMDEDLVLRLRNVTTQWSSIVLDQIGILHQVYANVIELPGKSLFIADACSGIHSLYVLLAVGLFVSAWYRRSMVHLAFLLVSTFGWVLIENVARIVSVAFAWTKGYDLSIGWPHFALGIVLFVISSALIFSTDQFLAFLLPDRLGGWFFRWFSGDASRGTLRSVSSESGADAATAAAAQWQPSRLWLSIACVFPVLGGLQLIRQPSDAPAMLAGFTAELELPTLGETFLDEEMSGFRRDGYKVVTRVKGDPFGQESQQWTYRKGPLTASIYLDYPYAEPHDLCLCYSQIGWKVASREVLPAGELSGASQPINLERSIATANLTRPFYGDAMILFSQFDLSGNHIASIRPESSGSVDQRLGRRFASPDDAGGAIIENTAATQPSEPSMPPYVQVQIFATGIDASSTAAQRQELLSLYQEVNKKLRGEVLRLHGKSPSSTGATP